jgi:DNA modification methylase
VDYEILQGDCRAVLPTLPAGSVQCVVTSPPYYGLRSYNGGDAEIGLEPTPAEYVANLVAVFREVWRVLADDGVVFLNLGDSYANDTKWGGVTGGKHAKGLHGGSEIGRGRTNSGLPSKCLMGIPWRVALALVDDGWTLRQDNIWHKTNAMPESVTDRTTRAHEYVFLLTKQARYYYDHEAIKEPAVKGHANSDFNTGKTATHQLGRSSDAERVDDGTRNRRSVWTIPTSPYAGAHFATMPPALVEPCILAGSRPGDTILDPFNGSGTTGAVARKHNRRYIGIELNPEYIALAHARIADYAAQPMLLETSPCAT